MTLDEMKAAISPEQREKVDAIALKALALEIGRAIVDGLAEAAEVADEWSSNDHHRVEDGNVTIYGRYDIEALGRAALGALGVGAPVTGTGGG